MLLGPEVPPVILQRILPQRESRDPTMICGRALLRAASRYSGSRISTSTMSPRRFGPSLSNRSVR